MYIDTDPDTTQAASHGSGAIIDPSQIILTRLNRPSHYIKAVGGRSSIDSWFNSKLLYRMQRNPLTTGIRALGRLAFVDHYKTIVGRMQAELELCSQPDVLTKANRHTRLGLRTNYPRVYVIAGLAGGTGSGMFIDVAYVAAQQLRQLGYVAPQVIGICYVPDPIDRQSASAVALGNSYAALTELNHYSQPGVSFSFKFDDREPKLKDRDPPFRRTLIVPLEQERYPERVGESTRLVGDFLFRELATPLGRTAEGHRVPASAGRKPPEKGVSLHLAAPHAAAAGRPAPVPRAEHPLDGKGRRSRERRRPHLAGRGADAAGTRSRPPDRSPARGLYPGARPVAGQHLQQPGRAVRAQGTPANRAGS
jgi:hypothetical protein